MKSKQLSIQEYSEDRIKAEIEKGNKDVMEYQQTLAQKSLYK